MRKKKDTGVVYIPPYSPEFNPIEKAWAKIEVAK
ncbi:MAG: transposase [Deltaproteobacteria bacterium]|nr:transposase [Deltaproteobacteria bacterium]